jgi:hypothetical protein
MIKSDSQTPQVSEWRCEAAPDKQPCLAVGKAKGTLVWPTRRKDPRLRALEYHGRDGRVVVQRGLFAGNGTFGGDIAAVLLVTK